MEPTNDTRAHLDELIHSFRTAMLVTRSAEGQLRARPLSLGESRDNVLYFATSLDSPKVQEIARESQVAVTFQDTDRYISVTGTAVLSRDPALVNQLWNEAWKVWFPGGKTDPTLGILVVRPQEAEYWDQSGLKGVRFLFEAAKAYIKGTTPESGGASANAKVKL